MKKNVFHLAVFMCVVLFFVSCAKQEDYSDQSYSDQCSKFFPVPSERQEMKQLIKTLKEHNENYRATPVGTRSFGGWFRKILRITCADAVGAICGAYFGPWGAIAGGVTASAYAYSAEKDLTLPNALTRNYIGGIDTNPVLADEDMRFGALANVVLISNIPMCTDSVGFYHNKILLYLNTHNMLHVCANTDSLTNAICEQAEEISDNGRGTTTNNQLLQQLCFSQFKMEYPYMAMAETFEDFIGEYVLLYPELEDDLWFIYEYILTLCNIDPEENDGSYAEEVLELINDSQVSNDIKKRLGDAVITGYASSKLWNFDN